MVISVRAIVVRVVSVIVVIDVENRTYLGHRSLEHTVTAPNVVS